MGKGYFNSSRTEFGHRSPSIWRNHLIDFRPELYPNPNKQQLSSNRANPRKKHIYNACLLHQ